MRPTNYPGTINYSNKNNKIGSQVHGTEVQPNKIVTHPFRFKVLMLFSNKWSFRLECKN
ncbi:hypothetical protein HanIR_Chr10g0486801 [Helianthus annuus]|nr:hypothetical protein HanIR_Chr10g0486801 [Helianthus annuus]